MTTSFERTIKENVKKVILRFLFFNVTLPREGQKAHGDKIFDQSSILRMFLKSI